MAEIITNRYIALCPLCGETSTFDLADNELINNMQGELATFTLESHGDPPHILFVYIDKDRNIRGTYPFLVKQSAPLGKRGLNYNHLVDATSDITTDEAESFGIGIIPYDVHIDGKSKKSYPNEISLPEILGLLIQNRKLESLPVPTEKFVEKFTSIDNDLPIIVNTISSQISKNYKNAMKAKKIISKSDPKLANRINIVDSLAAGSILKTMAKKSVEMDRKGRELQEIMMYSEWLRHYHRTYFIVHDTEKIRGSNFLGRFSGILGGKPLIACNIDGLGKIEPCKNVQTFKEGLGEIGRLIKKDFLSRKFTGTIFHALSEQNAYRLLEYLSIMFKIEKEELQIESCCSTISINGGLGVLGLSIYPKM
ncbi:MAG: DegV family EDD domain-containing protein [Candidatus Heimdallarchaeota archaeon]|nr:DegV family EDD domain-containing protein [Candidatus Heimdallarchaeota archaeon]MBY8995476.1 DegV family EDD domain-containing protein [Candidatus Heimdallarchaeota archaeon]